MNDLSSRGVATFSAGCFWGVEDAFRRVPGVISVEVGYTGGTTVNPTYEQVCTGQTGHAEAVEVTYDPTQVSYEELLAVFWRIHDPTQKDGQGLDMGTQYRSAIFYRTEDERTLSETSRDECMRTGIFGQRSPVTEIVPVCPWYRAEEYHQKYHQKRGNTVC
jgi:peptide-methionine (S)-S-oxide reductase